MPHKYIPKAHPDPRNLLPSRADPHQRAHRKDLEKKHAFGLIEPTVLALIGIGFLWNMENQVSKYEERKRKDRDGKDGKGRSRDRGRGGDKSRNRPRARMRGYSVDGRRERNEWDSDSDGEGCWERRSGRSGQEMEDEWERTSHGDFDRDIDRDRGRARRSDVDDEMERGEVGSETRSSRHAKQDDGSRTDNRGREEYDGRSSRRDTSRGRRGSF